MKTTSFLSLFSIICVAYVGTLSEPLHSSELLVSLSGSSKHLAWDAKPAELCGVEVKNQKAKGALYLPCDTTVSSVRFFESEAINILVEIEPTKIGPSLGESDDVTGNPVYHAASRKISEMEEKDRKFRKDLETAKNALFDKKALLLHDVMYLPMPLDTVFTMYVSPAGESKGTIQELRDR